MNNQQLIESLQYHTYKMCEMGAPKDWNQIIHNIRSSEVLTDQEKSAAIQKAMKAAKQSDYDKARYQVNRDKIAAQSRAYYQANREKELARKRSWYQANKEKIAAYNKNNYQRVVDKEKRAAYMRVYRAANKDKINAQRKANYDPEKRKAQYQANKDKINAQRKKNS